MDIQDKPKYITIAEASRITGRSVHTIRRWENTGLISARRNPTNNYRQFETSQIDDLLELARTIKPGAKK